MNNNQPDFKSIDGISPNNVLSRVLVKLAFVGIRWRILAILCFLSSVSYLLRGNLSIAAPTMMADLKLDEVQWGWVMSAFPLSYALCQFPAGMLGDWIGPRKVLTIAVAAWAALIVLTSLIPSPGSDSNSLWLILGSLILIQLIAGVFHAPIYPVTNSATQSWFPLGGWSLPLGLNSTGLTLGLAATASLLPWLIDLYGWRTSFVLLAPVGLMGSVLWWWYGRDNPADHPAIQAAELELITRGREPLPQSDKPETAAWLRILKDRNALLLTLSYGCMCFIFYLMFSWGYYYMVEVRLFEEQEAGFLTSAQWIFAGGGAALGGWLGDYLYRKIGLLWGNRLPILIGMTTSALLLIGVALTPNNYVAAAMLGMCFFLNQTTEGPYWSGSIAIGGRHAGKAGGMLNTGGNAVGAASAALVPWVAKHYSWDIAMYLGGGFALIGAALILLVRFDQQMDQGE
jgi:ACS family glucarate transporter-like MFS transporter